MSYHDLPKQNLVYFHQELERQLKREHSNYSQKIDWIIRNFILDGTTSNIKTISYQSLKWRRTPIYGNDFYLWWISSKEPGTESLRRNADPNTWEFYFRLVRPHEDNRKELSLGTKDDYLKEQKIRDLYPCKDEQSQVIEAISNSKICKFKLDTIRGNPGSGKTVTLEYAAFTLSSNYDHKAQYITYTTGLKNRAKKFFDAHDASHDVQVFTFDEFLGSVNYRKKYNFQEFKKYLNNYLKNNQGLQSLGKKALGTWASNEDILWIELRAYIFGLSLPFDWQRGALEINGSAGLITKEEYQKLRQQQTSLEDQELDIAYTIASDLYQKPEEYKKIFPDLWRAYDILADFIRSERPKKTQKYYESIIIDEVQDLTLLQIALIFEKGRLLRNPDNPLAFRFIIAGDESQTLLPSGFSWGFLNNLFTSRFCDLDALKEYPFKGNYRNPKLIATLVEKTYDLYPIYTNKELIPQSSSKTSSFYEIQTSGMLVLWKTPDPIEERIEFLVKVSQDLDSFLSEVAFVDLSEERIEEYNKSKIVFPFYYSDKEIKGLEKKIVFILGLSEKIRELQSNQMKSGYINLLKNRRIIDSIRVSFSRSSSMLIVVDHDIKLIQSIFPSFVQENESWQEVMEVVKLEAKDITPEDELYRLINIANKEIDEEDLKRASQHLQRAKKIFLNVREKQSFEDLICNTQIKLLETQLSAIKRELINDNISLAVGILRNIIKSAQVQKIEIKSWNSYKEIQLYFNWLKTKKNIEKLKQKPLISASSKKIQNVLEVLQSISVDNYFVREEKIDYEAVKEYEKSVLSAKAVMAINEIKDEEQKILAYYEALSSMEIDAGSIFEQNQAFFREIEKIIWKKLKSIRDKTGQDFHKQSYLIDQYIQGITALLRTYPLHSPDKVFVFEYIIETYQKYYPLKSFDALEKFMQYGAATEIIAMVKESCPWINASNIRVLLFNSWTSDIINFLCDSECDIKECTERFDFKLFSGIYDKSPKSLSSRFTITESQASILKAKFPPSFVQKIGEVVGGIQSSDVAIEAEKFLGKIDDLIDPECLHLIDPHEKQYILSTLKSLCDRISEQNEV
jgi:hypothetical protein